MLQGAVGLTAGFALSVFLGLVTRVDWLNAYLAGYEPLNVGQNLRRLQLRALVEGRVFTDPAQSLPWEAVLLYLLVPAFLIGAANVPHGIRLPRAAARRPDRFRALRAARGRIAPREHRGQRGRHTSDRLGGVEPPGHGRHDQGAARHERRCSHCWRCARSRQRHRRRARTLLSGRTGAAALASGVALVLLVSPQRGGCSGPGCTAHAPIRSSSRRTRPVCPCCASTARR